MTTKIDQPAALPMQTRADAPVDAVNVERRTIDVVYSTGATVRRQRWVGWDTVVPFDETLVVSREAINDERLRLGAPALDSHSRWSTHSQVGVIENPRIDGERALATIRFPREGTDPAADRMFGMVSQGIIRNVSVGYSIDQVEVKRAKDETEVEQHRVVRWTPQEISFVPINADAQSQTVRSGETTFPLIVVRDAPLIVPTFDAAAARARMAMRQRMIG